MKPYKYQPKPIFKQRMDSLLKDDKDREEYWSIVHQKPVNSIRCNTLKISPSDLRKKLENLGWKIQVPYPKHPEIMIITNNLLPGQLGKTKEHLLGYYYVQEISSMMPMLALQPNEQDSFFDCCASPGSKTTQAAAMMNNKGIIIANELNMGRIRILASNLEKIGCSNTIITRNHGANICKNFKNKKIEFDKILVDAPCSGEGTLRSSPRTFQMWNPKMTLRFSRTQKLLASKALKILKTNGYMIYSTCTHAPEENEEVVQYLLDNFNISIEKIDLPLKTRPGILEWKDRKFDKQMEKAARIYPQDNNTEGFFICKIKKLGENQE